MEDEQKFEIVLHAGNAESAALMAMEAARERRFEEADALRAESATELSEAHRLHTSVLQLAARGASIEMDVLLVHAQDHLSMATVLNEVSNEIIALNKRVATLEDRAPTA